MNTRDQYTDELVSAYFDGELSGDERARVEQLLAQGGRESDWLEEIESLRQDMQLLPPKRLGSDFTQRTIHAARQSAAEAGRSTQPLATALAERDANYGWIGWVSGAAVLAAALLLAVFLMNSSTTPKPDETAITGAFAVAKKQRSKTSDEPIRDPSPQKSNLKKQGTDSPPLVGDEATKRGHSTPDVGTVDKDGKSDKREDGKSDKRENGKSDKRENGKSDKRENGKSDKRENGKSDKRENGVPSGQLLMVFDVMLTLAGREEGRFDRALVDQQVPFDATLTVDEELEATLMRSRFLQPAKEGEATSKDDVQLIYVVTRGGKIDEIWQAMRENKKHFSQIKCDLAFLPADQEVFRELRRAAEAEWAARDLANQNLAGAEVARDRTRAQRLVLPRSWKGVPAHRLGRLGLMPDWMQDQLDNAHLPKPQVQPVAPPRPAAGERLGEKIIAEALFVITTPRS